MLVCTEINFLSINHPSEPYPVTGVAVGVFAVVVVAAGVVVIAGAVYVTPSCPFEYGYSPFVCR